MPQLGLYAMYLYGRDNLIVNPRAETLGESLAIIWNVADADGPAQSPKATLSLRSDRPYSIRR